MDDLELCVVLVTAPHDQAAPLARTLVEERLAACVNILAGVRSIYRWQGKLSDDDECLLVIKTRRESMELLTKRICALHPYEVPEVLALAVDSEVGNPRYLEWLLAETKR